jgi:hypothetical protein
MSDRPLKEYDLDDLIDELEYRKYDFFEDLSDDDLEEECADRGIRLESEMVDYEPEFRRLQKLVYEAYMMSIEFNYCPDRLYKFIENNFRFA